MPNIDPQIAGVMDDGTESGVVRTKAVSTGLSLVPFRRSNYTVVKNGSGTSEMREEGDIFTGGYPIHFAQLLAAITNSIEVYFNFPGRRLGLAFVRNLPATDDFIAMIDGEAYRISGSIARQNDPSVSGPIQVAFVEVANNLPDAADHECRLIFTGNASTSPVFMVIGWLEESRFGRVTPPPLPRALEPVALTSSAVAFPHDNGGAGAHYGMRWFQKVTYYNVPQAITSITSSSTTATVTTTAVHNLVSGQQVTIAGALQPEYNGVYTITVTTTTVFTYTFAGSGTTPATGTKTFGAHATVIVSRNSVDLWARTIAAGADAVEYNPNGPTAYDEVVSETIGGGYNYKQRLLLTGPVVNATLTGGW